MTDMADREAFIADYIRIFKKSPSEWENEFIYESTKLVYKLWQACKAHYAPTVTEKEAVVLIGDAVRLVLGQADYGCWHEKFTAPKVIQALREAGVKFKE